MSKHADDMLPGLRILLERMETNPEEFTEGGPWADIVLALNTGNDRALNCLRHEELEALKKKYDEARRSNFTARILKRLTDGAPTNLYTHPNPNDYPNGYPKEWSRPYGISTTGISTTGTNGLGANTPTYESQLESLLRMREAQSTLLAMTPSPQEEATKDKE